MARTLLDLIRITLLAQNMHWVQESTWASMNNMTEYFFMKDSILLIGDMGDWRVAKPVYKSQGLTLPPLYFNIDSIVVVKSVREWAATDLRGNVIIITESLDILLEIWPKYKLTPLVVILQKVSGCDVYIWLPYKSGNCNREPELEWKGSCQDVDLTELKEPYVNDYKLGNCPLKASLVPCPMFVDVDNNGSLVGAEISILKALVKYNDMKLVKYRPKPPSGDVSRLWYYSKYDANGSLSGVWKLLDERVVDIGGSCQSIGEDKIPLEFLPSHLDDPVCWHLPGPQRTLLAYGFINALPHEIWNAILLIFIATWLFSYAANSWKDLGFVFSWILLRMLAMPSPPLQNTNVLRFFSVLFELCFIVVTTTYRSFLLYNLFVEPMMVLKTGEEGAQHGLMAYMRERDGTYFKNSNSNFIEPGRLVITQSFDFGSLVVKKTAMILARTILDQAQIRQVFPNISYSSAVTVDNRAFSNNYVIFLMPPKHPLAPVLSQSLLNIIQAGLPALYLKRALLTLPRDGISFKSGDKTPLGYDELASVFYTWSILIAFTSLIFISEMATHYIVKRYFTKRQGVPIHKENRRVHLVKGPKLEVRK